MTSIIFSRWMADQKPRAHAARHAPALYRNLEEALDVRRKNHALYTLMPNVWTEGKTIDFCSNDCLALGNTGRLREAYNAELARNPDMQLSVGGSRLMAGNYAYIEMVEQEIADYHGVEAALLVGSGADGNRALLEGVPRPGDVIVYDELCHASILDGMSRSLATTRIPFTHNDVDACRDALISVWDSQPLVRQGKKCVIIVLESFYSMGGDMSPLEELVQAAKEIFPGGNAQFMVDEAHSMGVLGTKGLGFVDALGLSSEIALRTHTFSKSFGSIGGVVLGNRTVKSALLNFSRSTIFTAAPAFHQVAAIRSAYALMPLAETEKAREHVQHLVKRFFERITADPIWEKANDQGIISIPVTEDWEERPFQTPIVSLWTRERYGLWLAFHLDARKYSAFPVSFPTVPKGHARVRMVMHADHTVEDVDGLVDAICEWAAEMVQIESGAEGRGKLPWAAQQVYMSIKEGVVGETGDDQLENGLHSRM